MNDWAFKKWQVFISIVIRSVCNLCLVVSLQRTVGKYLNQWEYTDLNIISNFKASYPFTHGVWVNQCV